MSSTFYGRLASKVLTWWQFERLYFGKNYLTTTKRPTFFQWLRLLFASNLLEQDRVLCELYDMNYKEYMKALDMRWTTKTVRQVNYLLSAKDILCSQAHLDILRAALEGSIFNYKIVHFGGHGEFTLKTRNDFLIQYCEMVICRTQT